MSYRNPFGWDYPAGAEFDPNAPWNEVDEDEKEPEPDWDQKYDEWRERQHEREMEDY